MSEALIRSVMLRNEASIFWSTMEIPRTLGMTKEITKNDHRLKIDHLKPLSALALTILMSCAAFAQEKNEREWRVRTKEIPQAAMEWFKDAYELPKHVKWYGETNETGNYFEAKLKWKGHRHSVKFTEQGTVVDIEIEKELKALPDAVQQKIQAELDSISASHRILKLQEQWTGEPDDLEDLIDEKEKDNLDKRYELEVFFRNGDNAGYHELMFSATGKLKSMRPMNMNTADHLQY